MLDFENLKKVFYLEAEFFFMQKGKKFIVDDFNEEALDVILMYFSNSIKFETEYSGDLSKGIILKGGFGTGKTSTFEIIHNISKKYKLSNLWFKNTTCKNVYSDFKKQKEDLIEYYSKGSIYFDDLGSESISNDWGIKKYIMCDVLEHRYEKYRISDYKTYITTNLSIKELGDRYGQRLIDRFHEMFNFIELDSCSRRKQM